MKKNNRILVLVLILIASSFTLCDDIQINDDVVEQSDTSSDESGDDTASASETEEADEVSEAEEEIENEAVEEAAEAAGQDTQTVKVAFIGDQGLSDNAISVLTLINDEGADFVLHQGDFDYKDDPDAWDDMINDNLGESYPYFASIGNHDKDKWDDYQDKLEARLAKIDGAVCEGDLGVNSHCTYKGIFFILSGVGTQGSDHEEYIQEQLDADNSIWRVCTWHKNQRLMQAGSKPDEVGWEAYENCRRGGAIIATGHEHMYNRSHLMSDIETQVVSSTSNTLTIDEGETFVFVSAIAGKSIRSQDDDLAANDWWASIYTSDQNANHGALFCTFNDTAARKASCYFKNIDGDTVDEFSLVSAVNQ